MKAIKPIVIVLFAFLAVFFVYYKFFSYSALGESIFNKIDAGRLRYAPTLQGQDLVDLDDITTNKVVVSILTTNNKTPSVKDILDYKPRIFEIPSSIRNHKFVSKTQHDFDSTIKETRLTYNVETPLQDYSVQLVFLNIKGEEKLGAMFSQPK